MFLRIAQVTVLCNKSSQANNKTFFLFHKSLKTEKIKRIDNSLLFFFNLGFSYLGYVFEINDGHHCLCHHRIAGVHKYLIWFDDYPVMSQVPSLIDQLMY